MKISIIIPIFNSHEAVARQVKYFNKMNLPDDTEFIFVDDGSNPPLNIADYDLKNLRIHATNDKRPWTQGLARNAGAKLAAGEYLFMTDIDHILSKEAIDDVYKFNGSRMVFPRYLGVLLPDGELSEDLSVLKEYGADMNRLKTKRGFSVGVHGNTFAIKKSIFEELGGYNQKRCTYGHYAGYRRGEDCYFNAAWKKYALARGLTKGYGSKIFVFPVARFNVNRDKNPKGLFHNLSYEETSQPMKE
ncbi:MAG: glycosyltransferase [Candidatus Paceibacterota bacterium]